MMFLTGMSNKSPFVLEVLPGKRGIMSKVTSAIVGTSYKECQVEGEKENELKLLDSMREKIEQRKYSFPRVESKGSLNFD